MRAYWPCAIRLRDDGTEESLFTYDSSFSLEGAMKAFTSWKFGYGFNLVRCWIDVYEGENKIGTEEVWDDDIKGYDYYKAHSHDCSRYFVSTWEQSPDSYTLEVVDGLWETHDRVVGVPGWDVHRVEMELMHKWKDEMAKYGFVPAKAYEKEMEG